MFTLFHEKPLSQSSTHISVSVQETCSLIVKDLLHRLETPQFSSSCFDQTFANEFFYMSVKCMKQML